MANQKTTQLKIGALLTYLTMGVGIIISLVYTPFMIRLLGQSEYGLYNLATSIIAYLGVLNFGFGSAYIRYFSRYKKNNDDESISKLNGMFIKIFTFISLFALVAGIIISFFSNQVLGKNLTSQELEIGKVLMIILTVNIVLKFPTTIFSTYIRVNEHFIFERTITLIGTIVNPFIILPVLFAGFGSIGLVIVLTLSSLIIEITHILYAFKKLKFKVSFDKVDKILFKEITVFSSFIFLSMIVDQINWNVDKYLLGRISGTAAVAVYSIASIFNIHYLNLSTAISSVFVPRVHQIVNGGDSKRQLTLLFTKVGRIQFMLLSLVLSGFILFGRPFIIWWAGDDYKSSYLIAVILLSAVTIPIIQNLGIEIQQALNLHKFRSITYLIIAISNVLISIPLIYMFEGVGAALGTAVSLFVGNIIIMNIYYHRVVGIDIPYFWNEIIKIFPAFIFPVGIGIIYIFNVDINKVIYFIIGAIVYSTIFVISMWFIGMNKYERDMVINPIKMAIMKCKK